MATVCADGWFRCGIPAPRARFFAVFLEARKIASKPRVLAARPGSGVWAPERAPVVAGTAIPPRRQARRTCDIFVVTRSISARFSRSVVGTPPAFRFGVAAPSTTYEPRCPAQTALYQIVRDHVETFRVQTACLRDGEGLPRFVEQEFRNFLRCGSLAGGFARFRCGDCGLDRLVPFSCKSRAVCPSCGGRRMAERAAHLLDHVFPDVPVRHRIRNLRRAQTSAWIIAAAEGGQGQRVCPTCRNP